ncbi:MAG TPA: TIGR03915 family putative DNA repair protein [Bacillota bacterium]|nr:TIGR03915 family putative DNA repair protein [Bacillota bacterium]
MRIYIYDGSFEGLLTAIKQCLTYNGKVSEITTPERYQPDLFSDGMEIKTISEEARKFYRQLEGLSKEITATISYAFLSEQSGVEMLIYEYIKTVFRYGVEVITNMNHPAIYKLYYLRRKVLFEIGRYHGFVRFQQLPNGIFYSPIEPDYNIVQFLAPHFSARFADQRWMIHDIRRGTGIFYDLTHCVYLSWVDRNHPLIRLVLEHPEENALPANIMELKYQRLWKDYFKAIAIQERHNTKVQRQHMPRRYWKHLIEDVEV